MNSRDILNRTATYGNVSITYLPPAHRVEMKVGRTQWKVVHETARKEDALIYHKLLNRLGHTSRLLSTQ